MKRGIFILFEGCDKSGKTTQSELLINFFNNVLKSKTILIKFPDRTTETGKLIDSYLKKKFELDKNCCEMLFSANRWEKHSFIKNTLNNGTNIVMDRYAYSGIVYSGTCGNKWSVNLDVGLVEPDVIFFLDNYNNLICNNPYELEERYESLEFQKKVYLNFQKILFHNDECKRVKIFNIISSNKSIDEIHQKIKEIYYEEIILLDYGEGDFKYLW